MTNQVENSGSSGLNIVKWALVIVLLVAATLGNHYGDNAPAALRLGGMVLLAVVALGIALLTTQGRNFLGLLKEANVERRKVVWPTKQETWRTTLIVMAVVLLTSLLLWGIDSLFGWAVSAVIGS